MCSDVLNMGLTLFSWSDYVALAPPRSCVAPSWATVAHLETSEHTHVKNYLSICVLHM